MNAHSTIKKPATASDLHPNHSNFVFVANSSGFATAVYSSGTPTYEVHDLPGLPGVLVTPKPLFGIDTGLFSHTADLQAAAGSGNLEKYVFGLLAYLSAEASPETADRQTARVSMLANRAACQARGTFDRTDDIGYATDLASSYSHNVPVRRYRALIIRT